MKKLFISTLAVAALLCSCSSDDDFAVNGNPSNESDIVAIKLGVSAGVTRGTGTVGGVNDGSLTTANNHWNSEKVNVFMFKKGTLELAYFVDGRGDSTEIYNNEVFTTPSSTEDPNTVPAVAVGGVKYFPPQGNYDFWGYRLDDANPGIPVNDSATVKVSFTIDGSQDVMAAKAVLTPAQETSARSWGADSVRFYSAYSARKGVQPNMVFNHLLTRLNFQIIAGDTNVIANQVKLDTIAVESHAAGILTVADTLGLTNAERIEWTDSTDNALYLKERLSDAVDTQLTDLTPVYPGYDTDTLRTSEGVDSFYVHTPKETQVGEALLVAPQTSYKILVKLSQPDKNDPSNILSYTYVFTMNPPSNTFEMGKSYNVKLTIYGLQEIQVTTSLAPWEDAGDIEITPEDEVQ